MSGFQREQLAGDVDGSPGRDPSLDLERFPISLKHYLLRNSADGENATVGTHTRCNEMDVQKQMDDTPIRSRNTIRDERESEELFFTWGENLESMCSEDFRSCDRTEQCSRSTSVLSSEASKIRCYTGGPSNW